MTHDSETWLTENDVVGAVAEHLRKTGWKILQISKTAQQGIDILAERSGVTLAVEAKGGGSSKPGTSGYGKSFTSNQNRSHVAVAVLTALRETSRGRLKTAIAFPNDPVHLRLIEGIWPALQKLNINVYFVAPDKSVKCGMFGANA